MSSFGVECRVDRYAGISVARHRSSAPSPSMRSSPTNHRRRSPLGVHPLPHRAPHKPPAQLTLCAGRSRMLIAVHGLRKASEAIEDPPQRSCFILLPSRATPYLAPAAGTIITATPLRARVGSEESPHRSCLNLLPSRATPYLAPAAGTIITATPLARASRQRRWLTLNSSPAFFLLGGGRSRRPLPDSTSTADRNQITEKENIAAGRRPPSSRASHMSKLANASALSWSVKRPRNRCVASRYQRPCCRIYRKYALVPGLSRPPQYPEHYALHCACARPVQRILERLGRRRQIGR